MIRVRQYFLLILFLPLFFCNCEGFKQTSKKDFNEGFYKSRLFHKNLIKVYVVPREDQIDIYPEKGHDKIDTTVAAKIIFTPDHMPGDFKEYLFHRNSVDIDVNSTVLKYRPSVSGFPNQLNTSIFNGAVFVGYRNDIFKIKYKENPLYELKRSTRHYGFSAGVFAGLGTTPMNEYVTLSNIAIEYDGFVNVEGVALILSIRKLNFGFNLGVEHLMDPNRKFWIYQGKPWLGICIGLHLD